MWRQCYISISALLPNAGDYHYPATSPKASPRHAIGAPNIVNASLMPTQSVGPLNPMYRYTNILKLYQ